MHNEDMSHMTGPDFIYFVLLDLGKGSFLPSSFLSSPHLLIICDLLDFCTNLVGS
jgi:hypothetical protein